MKIIIALTAAMITAGTISAQVSQGTAQPVVKRSGAFTAIPGYVTNDGKGRLSAVSNINNDVRISIIDTNLRDEAEFVVPASAYKVSTTVEEALVKAANYVTVRSVDQHENDVFMSVETLSNVTGINVTNAATLAQALNDFRQRGDQYAGYELPGYDYCALDTGDIVAYLNYNRYGKAFPKFFVAVRNGVCYYVEREYDIDESGLMVLHDKIERNEDLGFQFTAVENSLTEEYRIYNVIGTQIFNIDKGEGNVDIKEIYATQTLFNGDDQWECLVMGYDGQQSASQVSYRTSLVYEADGFWHLHRRVTEAPESPNCLKIVSQNGSVVATLSDIVLDEYEDDVKVFIINGAPHFLVEKTFPEEDGKPTHDVNGDGIIDDRDLPVYACLYRYGNPSDGITLVSRTPANDDRTYNIAGQRISLTGNGIVIRNGRKYVVGK